MPREVTVMVVLRPLWITRITALAPGALVLAFGLGVGLADGGSWTTGGVAAGRRLRSELPGPQRSRMVAFRTGTWAPPAVREHNAECVAVLRRTVPPRPGR